MVTNSLGGRLM